MRSRLRDPVMWASAAQLAKTMLAAVLAWVVAVEVFHVTQAFLAPWAALLTVHATIYGTLKRGLQQVAATVVGVLAGFAAGTLFGLDAVAVGAAVLVGLVAGQVRGLRSESTTAAATAVVVLTAGYSDDAGMLLTRLLDTGIGCAVGLLVNLVVWPPLRDRAAARRIDAIDDRIGGLLCQIARQLRRGRAHPDAWIACTNELDEQIDEAWAGLGQARESGRLNPRRAVRGRMRAAQDLEPVLTRLEQAVAETRSLALTIKLAHVDWDPAFRDTWVELLERAGAAVAGEDRDAVRAVHADVRAFAAGLEPGALPGTVWPVAGALMVNLRNMLEALAAVAGEQPVEVGSPV
jgi:uncharacterized membrane protein YgaE (UPF0421/DUF939 family)